MITIYIFYIYLALGFILYLYLILGKQLIKLDEDTAGSGLGFKLLILPGTIALWPFLLFNLIKSPK